MIGYSEGGVATIGLRRAMIIEHPALPNRRQLISICIPALIFPFFKEATAAAKQEKPNIIFSVAYLSQW